MKLIIILVTLIALLGIIAYFNQTIFPYPDSGKAILPDELIRLNER